MTVQLLNASQIDPTQLTSFLERFFGSTKANFLREHGEWLHGGQENRWVLLVDGVLAGYCAVIPTQVSVDGKSLSAIWWVDIIVAPEFRGQGLQSHFDQKLQQDNLLKLGFPNELAAKIHRKHQWGVREDLQVRLCPLRPLKVKQVRTAQGRRGVLLKLGALALSPITAAFRIRLRLHKSARVFTQELPSARSLAEIVERTPAQAFPTTCRDAAYFQHRFLDAPYAGELAWFFHGPMESPTHYLVTRTLQHHGVTVTRILDFFGDLSAERPLRELLQAAVADADRKKSSQLTVMVTLPSMEPDFKAAGFVFKTPARFCWLSSDPAIMESFARPFYFTLADSDNDEIS